MFERIKLRVMKGAQLKPFAVAKVLQEHEDRLKALENPTEEEQQEVTPTTRSVSITINDGTDPVQGASVVIDGGDAKTTGSAGGCTASLTDGNHTVVVTKEGFTDKTETITVSSEDTSFTISLTAVAQSSQP